MEQQKTSPEARSRFGKFTRETVKQILASRGWTQTRASEAWGIPQATLSELLRGINAATASTITPILEAEGWDPVTFFLHHPKLSARHLELGDSALHEQYNEFVAAVGSDEGIMRTVRFFQRINKLGLRDEVAGALDGILTVVEHAAAGRSNRGPRRR